jgi:hypothetical protein
VANTSLSEASLSYPAQPDPTVALTTGNASAGKVIVMSQARHRLPAAGTALIGTLVVLIGVWAGLVPFVGPAFAFSADGSSSWMWTLPHAVLWAVPGAVAVDMGLLLLLMIPRAAAGRARATSVWAGCLIAASGAWLALGLYVWPVIGYQSEAIRPASPLRELAYRAAWNLGPGLALVLLGGCAIGTALRSTIVTTEMTSAPYRFGAVSSSVETGRAGTAR